MASIPGPRTHPTVLRMATMNNQQSSSWEVRLGLLQIVLVVGIITGSMLAIFALGFSSGQHSGLDLARQAATSELPRIPITEDLTPTDSPAAQTEIYAKLNDSGVRFAETATEPENSKEALAKNSSVADLEATNSEVKGSTETAALQIGSSDATATLADEKKGKHQVVRMLGGEDVPDSAESAPLKEKEDGKTLGGLIKKESRAVVTISEPENKGSDPAAETSVKNRSAEPVTVETGKTAIKAEKERVTTEKPLKSDPVAVAKVGSSSGSAKKFAFVSSLPKGWFVQIAAPKSSEEAEAVAGQLSKSGFPVMIEKAEVRGERYFRVVVGPERSRELSERLSGQIKRDGAVKGDPFIRMVR